MRPDAQLEFSAWCLSETTLLHSKTIVQEYTFAREIARYFCVVEVERAVWVALKKLRETEWA